MQGIPSNANVIVQVIVVIGVVLLLGSFLRGPHMSVGARRRGVNQLVLPQSTKESASKGRRPSSSPPESSLARRGD